jgi:hypothetical protein
MSGARHRDKGNRAEHKKTMSGMISASELCPLSTIADRLHYIWAVIANEAFVGCSSGIEYQ